MKNIIYSSLIAILITGCINSSTTWSNRSVTYQASHELLGERAQVSESPHSNDANLSAEKTYETSTKANLGQAVTDSSSTDQHRSAAEKPTTDKPVEKTNETDKK